MILSCTTFLGCEKRDTSTANTTDSTSTTTAPYGKNTSSSTTPSNTTTSNTTPRTTQNTNPSDVDNTANNRGDGSEQNRTPPDQSEASEDIKVTAEIRRAIMNDETMSVNAQNCKIITQKGGIVTLRGVVNSQAEKDSIESKAKLVAGVSQVYNQLEVKVN